MEEKETWGGKREGAGRPKGSVRGIKRHYKNVTLNFLEEDLVQMKELAKKEAPDKSFSRYVADKILGR